MDGVVCAMKAPSKYVGGLGGAIDTSGVANAIRAHTFAPMDHLDGVDAPTNEDDVDAHANEDGVDAHRNEDDVDTHTNEDSVYVHTNQDGVCRSGSARPGPTGPRRGSIRASDGSISDAVRMSPLE